MATVLELAYMQVLYSAEKLTSAANIRKSSAPNVCSMYLAKKRSATAIVAAIATIRLAATMFDWDTIVTQLKMQFWG